MKTEIAQVTISIEKEPGGPRPSAADVVAWVETLMSGRATEGANACQYSDSRVVSLVLREQRK